MSSPVTTTGQVTAVWSDDSGSRHLRQTSAGSRPVYNVVGGYPGLTTDGADDFMWSDLIDFGSTPKLDIWCVFQYTTSALYRAPATVLGTATTDAGALTIYSNAGSTQVRAFAGGSSNEHVINGIGINTRFIARATVDTTLATNETNAYVDGATATGTRPTNVNSTNTTGSMRFRIGGFGVLFVSGTFHSAAVFGTVLDATAASRVQAYLKSRWGTA